MADKPKYRVLTGMVVGPINLICRVGEELYVVRDEPIKDLSALDRAELICAALNAYQPEE
jgi:hypothetical protein